MSGTDEDLCIVDHMDLLSSVKGGCKLTFYASSTHSYTARIHSLKVTIDFEYAGETDMEEEERVLEHMAQDLFQLNKSGR